MIQTLKASDVRSNWSQLLSQVFRGETEILVEKSGIPVVAIVSTQDYLKLKEIKLRREKDFAILSQIRTAFADQTPKQINKGVMRSIAKVRKEQKL
ncbi:type II toxin-antitoxin system Phd/YefM family antitoxin [Candidatus Roizmanbacteria bacterium]|nr:type II toxin-antitoxin system Phd/YefM family antitoxin [Candidatus Roizmanbacteria bacterium]